MWTSALRQSLQRYFADLSGAAGGTTGLFTMLVSEIIGGGTCPVEIVRDGTKRSIMIGRKIQGEIEMITGRQTRHPVMVSNSKYWMGPDIIAAKGPRNPRCVTYGRVLGF